MAIAHVTRPKEQRKPFVLVPQDMAGFAPPAPPARDGKDPHGAWRCPTRHLTVDQYVRLLACIEREGGVATLDEIARALPMVERPVSAVFDLCDAAILSADLGAALGGDTRVWRLDR